MKPQYVGGFTDFDKLLFQFEITCLNYGCHYTSKSLYLENCLNGDARNITSELDHYEGIF